MDKILELVVKPWLQAHHKVSPAWRPRVSRNPRGFVLVRYFFRSLYILIILGFGVMIYDSWVVVGN